MRYELTEPEQPWPWRRMLNGMRPETLERVVGPGIIGICCKPIHGSYDQARRHAAKVLKIEYAADAPVPLLDFVVFRADGTAVRFHPSQTTTKINLWDAALALDPLAVAGDALEHIGGQARGSEEPPPPPPVRPPPGLPTTGPQPPPAPPFEYDLVD